MVQAEAERSLSDSLKRTFQVERTKLRDDAQVALILAQVTCVNIQNVC